MTDLRRMLHESAPAPRRPLDMREVRRRAERARSRRVLTWLGGLGVALGLGLPVGGAVLAPADRAGTLDGHGGGGGGATSAPEPALPVEATPDGRPSSAVRDAPAAPTAGTSRRPADRTADAGDGGAVEAPPPREDGRSVPTSSPAADGRHDGGPSQQPVGSAHHPAASACSVDNAGLAPGAQRICRFTATARGGATMRSDGAVNAAGNGSEGHVTITRQGTRRTHEVRHNSAQAGDLGVFGCGDELIEPGDLVEVVLTNGAGSPDGSTTTLGAGDGWHCWR